MLRALQNIGTGNCDYKVGEEITEKLTEEQNSELIEGGFAEEFEPEIPEEFETEMISGHISKEDLETMKVEDLRELAKEMGLETEGKKAELIERIAAVEVDAPANESE